MAFLNITANDLAHQLLAAIYSGSDTAWNTLAEKWTGVTGLTISLHTDRPVDDAGTTQAELVAGGNAYARKNIVFGDINAGSIFNTGELEWANLPAATITHCVIWHKGTDTPVQVFVFDVAKTVAAGDTLKIPASALEVSLNIETEISA